MEKDIFCTNTQKYLEQLHDYIVYDYYLITKSQPPDFVRINNITILLLPS